MENMDKGLTVPKWVLVNCSKIPQMPQNLSAQIVCPSPNVWDFNEKRLHWASVVCCLWTRHRYRVSIISFLGNLLFWGHKFQNIQGNTVCMFNAGPFNARNVQQATIQTKHGLWSIETEYLLIVMVKIDWFCGKFMFLLHKGSL